MSGYHKNEVYALLNDKGIPYEAVEHEAVFTMEEMERAGIDAHGCICKNLFLRDAKGRQHYLVTVPDERRVDLKWLSAALSSSKLSFASAERLDTYPKLPQGSVSPLGILNDESRSVIFAADAALASLPAIGVHPNDNTATVFLSFADLRRIIEAHGNSVVLIDFPSARRKRDLPPRSRHAQCRKRGFLRRWDFSDFYKHFFALLKNLMYICS